MKEKNFIATKEKKVSFTDTQLRVLRLWAEEASVEKVADKMGTSRHTVYTQLKRMRKKLGVNRTICVYKYARDKGLID